MELIGKLHLKYDEQKVNEKFKKRDFILLTDYSTPYPNHISIQLTQDKCSMLDSFNIGDEMKVQINITGKEWSSPNGIKYFNTITGWRIEKIGNSQSNNSNQNNNYNSNNNTSAPVFNSSIDDNDNLPFN